MNLNDSMSQLRKGDAVRFVRFALVGASGVVVDTGCLWVLTQWFGWPVASGKLAAAGIAVINNFIWNDCWTFRSQCPRAGTQSLVALRFARFSLICLGGIAISTLLLHGLVHVGHAPLSPSNLFAIVIACVWNFHACKRWNWKTNEESEPLQSLHAPANYMPGLRNSVFQLPVE